MRAHNDAEREQGRADTWLVGLVWFATTIVLWNFSAHYVSVLPFTDDVAMAPVLASDQPFRWELLWAHHNEHRIPLVKALYLALVFGLHDLRAGAWFQAATLPLASLGLLYALRRRRGRLELTDAVLPLLLHEIGNAENLLNSFQLAFALPALIVCALLALAVGWQRAPRWPGIATLWVLILMLAGCGGVGLPLAAGLAGWPVYLGWRARREQAAGWGASFAVALVGSGLLVCALAMYASSLELQPGFQAAGFALSLHTAAQFLSTGIGVTAGLFGIWPGLLVLFVLGVAGAWLVRASLRSATRPLALPLAGVLLGSLALAGLIGWGRGNDDPNAGLTNRYVILAAVPLCAAQLALRLVANGTLARFTRLVLFAIVLASAARNYEFGTQVGSERAELTGRVLSQMRAGAGADEIAHEHFASFFYNEGDFAGDLRDLQQAGLMDDLHPGERLPADGDPYAALGARPTRVEAELPAEVRRIDDRYALFVRGPARVEYEIPPGARRVQGRAAFLGHGSKTRARFVLEAGRATLQETQLASPGMREAPVWSTFELELPPERPAKLRLRFEPEDARPSRTWSLIGALHFR